MNVINVGYDSTNYYLVQTLVGWLMVDTGWAGTLPKQLHILRQKGIDAKKIKHLVITHFHPDHAGLVQDLKDRGATLILHPCQVPFVEPLKALFKPRDNFTEIRPEGNLIVSSPESRALLHGLGLKGEIIPTPGHSNDSVSLVIDGECAFTGDLPGYAASNPTIADSWTRIRSYQVPRVLPGHGNPFSL